jgi:hypothetical protein
MDNVTMTGGIGGQSTYIFYLKIDESESKLTTPALIGPIELIAGEDIEQRNSINNNFGNKATSPVSGTYTPINKLIILSPYIALISLIGAISSIVIMFKKRRA